MTEQVPTMASEKRWLAEGVQRGMIREEVGARIFSLLVQMHHGETSGHGEPPISTEETRKYMEKAGEY